MVVNVSISLNKRDVYNNCTEHHTGYFPKELQRSCATICILHACHPIARERKDEREEPSQGGRQCCRMRREKIGGWGAESERERASEGER